MDILITIPEGDFPRPFPQVISVDDWTNFDMAFRALWEWMQTDTPLTKSMFCGIPLNDIEIHLLWEAHTRRGPFLNYRELRLMVPQRLEEK